MFKQTFIMISQYETSTDPEPVPEWINVTQKDLDNNPVTMETIVNNTENAFLMDSDIYEITKNPHSPHISSIPGYHVIPTKSYLWATEPVNEPGVQYFADSKEPVVWNLLSFAHKVKGPEPRKSECERYRWSGRPKLWSDLNTGFLKSPIWDGSQAFLELFGNGSANVCCGGEFHTTDHESDEWWAEYFETNKEKYEEFRQAGCSVCYDADPRDLAITKCGHVFCHKCINTVSNGNITLKQHCITRIPNSRQRKAFKNKSMDIFDDYLRTTHPDVTYFKGRQLEQTFADSPVFNCPMCRDVQANHPGYVKNIFNTINAHGKLKPGPLRTYRDLYRDELERRKIFRAHLIDKCTDCFWPLLSSDTPGSRFVKKFSTQIHEALFQNSRGGDWRLIHRNFMDESLDNLKTLANGERPKGSELMRSYVICHVHPGRFDEDLINSVISIRKNTIKY